MKLGRIIACLALAPGCLLAEESYEEIPLTDRDKRHWAWRPMQADRGTTIDSLIRRDLESAGIPALAPKASPEALLRRLHFTLTGLPPTPEEVLNFSLEDYETTIDELLSRPQYGERWAQHWLDVVRFAETDGFEHDKLRPDAWRYRDWVIDALNRDLPYDRFLAFQLAADELVPEDSPDRYATGFLLAGPDMPDINLEEERRHNVLNESTGTIGAAFLGLTLSCAQCHDHKTDPVSLADFYRMRAFLENIRMPAKNKSLPPLFSELGAEPAIPTPIRIKGDFRRAGPVVEPAFLRILNPAESGPAITETGESTGRRRALAEWLCSPENPLVARVIANRVWMHHFGQGLVGTPNDFGRTGDRPTHPELLDRLALSLIESGWSLKALHRTILLSSTWQQTSLTPESEDDPFWQDRLDRDPQNRLYSRRLPQRLSGEAIRDAMLQASGNLNLEAGGPGIRPPLPAEVTVTLLKGQWPVTEDETQHDRRSIYLFLRRNLRYPFFDVFDKPDANLPCGRRHQSTTAPQSLTLLNSAFSAREAERLADRLSELAPQEAIDRAFLLALGRRARPDEAASSHAFIASESWEAFALALFNLNEFVHLD